MDSPLDKPESSSPRFLANKADGADLYEGQSQNSLADNISQFLKENDDIKRKVIGIEGEWGSGKSNVIEILKTKLGDTYYFFVFDAWGHQEDLTRRSILEGLLVKLINDKVLLGNEWKNKLRTLLAKKVEKEMKNIPKLSWSVLLSILAILLTPISTFIAEQYLDSLVITETATRPGSSPTWYEYLKACLIILLPFIFLAGKIGYSYCKAPQGKGRQVLEELFYIYKGQEVINKSEETISEDEPTVRQFITFLKELEAGTDKKLIIVFDNMDRLPAIKVREIWSSIHTFFASDDNELKTWAVVPFDNDHILKVFKEDNDPGHADSYIHKTFSIVFHVPPPILSDWKELFNKKFADAFGYKSPPSQNIETIFDYYHLSNPKIKPRDIIYFINDLVALKQQWKDKIEFRYLALFALKRTAIIKNPFAQILSKEYLGTLELLFDFDEHLDTNIAALAFNVQLEKADEVLLKRPIENVFKGEGDFNVVSTHKSFFSVFKSVFYNYYKSNIIYVISKLNELPDELQTYPEMESYWEKLSDQLVKENKFDIPHGASINILITRIKENDKREVILNFLFASAIKKSEDGVKFYSGGDYYTFVEDMRAFLASHWTEKKIEDLLVDNSVEANEYLEFVEASGLGFDQYKVICDEEKLNSYLIERFKANTIVSNVGQILILKRITDFTALKTYIKNEVSTLVPNVARVEEILTNIIVIGNALSLDGRVVFQIPEITATGLLTAHPNHDRKVELLLSIISANIFAPNPGHVTETIISSMLADTSLVAYFTQEYKYYFTYSDLIKYDSQFPSDLTTSAIALLTSSNDSVEGSDVEFLLSRYTDIKSRILANNIDSSKLFITKINSFYNRDLALISDVKLGYIIPIIKDQHILRSECILIEDIILQANKYLHDLSKELWSSSLIGWESSLNVKLFKVLEETGNFIGKLPSLANDAHSEIIGSISRKELVIPSDIGFWNKLLVLRAGSIVTTFKNIRDQLLSHTHGDVTIEELNFFETGLFKFGKLDQNQVVADDTLRRIFIPLANNSEAYVSVLRRNATVVKAIIEKAKEAIVDFRNCLTMQCPEIFIDPECKEFCELLNERFNSLSPSIEDN